MHRGAFRERKRDRDRESVCAGVCRYSEVLGVRCIGVCVYRHTHTCKYGGRDLDRPQVPRVGESECNEADPGGRGLGESDLTLGNKPLRFCHVSRAFWHQEGFRV